MLIVNVTRAPKKKQVESIQLKMKAMVEAIEFEFATDVRPLSVIKLEGASAGLIVKSSYTQVDCSMASININDLNASSHHVEVSSIL